MSLYREIKYRNIIGTARYVSKVYLQIKKVRGNADMQAVIDYIALNRYNRKEIHQSKIFQSVIKSLNNSLGKIGLKDITVAILITETPYMQVDLKTRMEWDNVMTQVFNKLGFTPELIGSVIDLKFDSALEKILQFEFFKILENRTTSNSQRPMVVNSEKEKPVIKNESVKKPSEKVKTKPKSKNNYSTSAVLLLIALIVGAWVTLGSIIGNSIQPEPVYDWNSRFDEETEIKNSLPQKDPISVYNGGWSDQAESLIAKYRELHPATTAGEDDNFVARKIIEQFPELEKEFFPD